MVETTTFDAPARRISYLNHAKEATLSPAVKEAAREKLKKEAWDLDDSHDKQRVRELFASLIRAEPEDVAIVPSTAFSITMAANNIARLRPWGGKIVVLQDEMCSEVYAWQNVIEKNPKLSLSVVPIIDGEDDITQRLIISLDETCAVVCVPNLHWSTGALIDTIRISQVCSAFGIRLVIDGTQSIGILPFNVADFETLDMVACSVQKWLRAPEGNSLVYVMKDVHESWEPLDQHGRNRALKPNWNAYPSTMTPKGYPEDYLEDARKFDAGGHCNPVHVAMLRASMEEVVQLDMDQAQQQLTSLMDPLLKWASDNDWWVPSSHAGHLVGIRPRDVSIPDMLDICASLEADGIYITVRNGVFRVSPYLTNSTDDIERLIAGFERYLPKLK